MTTSCFALSSLRGAPPSHPFTRVAALFAGLPVVLESGWHWLSAPRPVRPLPPYSAVDPDWDVLFLDFDGVMHPGNSCTFVHEPALAALLRELPRVRLVVTSTWRLSNSLDDLREWFSPPVAARVVDVTPELSHAAGTKGSRQREIEVWLQQNPTARWCALDDQPELYTPDCAWLVTTNPRTGLDASALARVRQLLTRQL